MGWFSRITIVIMAAIFFVGMMELIGTVGISELKETASENPGKTAVSIIGFNQGLNAITPAFQYNISEKVPVIGGKHTIMINDIPVPDGTDMIILVPALLLLWFPILATMRKTNMNMVVWILVAIFGTILFSFFTWALIKIFWYWIYIWSAKSLGWTIEQAIATRESVMGKLGETIYIMLLFAAFSVVAMGKVMWDVIKGNPND
jgi:hypothetical protein